MKTIPVEQIARLRDAQRDVLRARLVEQEVCEYYGLIFSPRAVPTLSRQDVAGFLRYELNHRWREISKDDVTRDMDRLRAALAVLLDESLPVAERLNRLEPGRGELAVPHLGKAKLTPMLLVSQPKHYGVWNDYSERALRGMGLFPAAAEAPGVRLGDAYQAVNTTLTELAATYRVSLWRLDVLLEQIARLVR